MTDSTTVPGASSEGERLREALDRLPAATCYRTHTQPDEGKGVFGAVWKADVLRVAPQSEPGLRGVDPKYISFARRATEEMALRLSHGRAKFGVDWDEEPYTDEDNLARLRRAVDHLEAAHRSTPDPDEWRKRAADVANQAFMFADPARLGEGPSRG